MYAIIKTGGKQYRAEAGNTLMVEKIEAEPGAQVELNEVLMISDGDNARVGTPTLEGAKVIAEVTKQSKGKKIVGFTYKAKKNQRRRFGHRQPYTWLKVTEIQG
ncbi:MAG: 50S ribosomal protein L21 [Fimbriimonadia bacterium]|nr:50S ribosomal protein L21 [Fimbriimonadia bacterium]